MRRHYCVARQRDKHLDNVLPGQRQIRVVQVPLAVERWLYHETVLRIDIPWNQSRTTHVRG